jgi:hypothetical protein
MAAGPEPETVSSSFWAAGSESPYWSYPARALVNRFTKSTRYVGYFRTAVLAGNPDPKHISTSFVERPNLTMRMSMRRFTRLTNAHSKKLENHEAAIALHYMHYNFCRIHSPLRVTPAMEAGLAGHVWNVKELVGLLTRLILVLWVTLPPYLFRRSQG